jgi:hypothetical protein
MSILCKMTAFLSGIRVLDSLMLLSTINFAHIVESTNSGKENKNKNHELTCICEFLCTQLRKWLGIHLVYYE